jgi:hypothetical protein
MPHIVPNPYHASPPTWQAQPGGEFPAILLFVASDCLIIPPTAALFHHHRRTVPPMNIDHTPIRR